VETKHFQFNPSKPIKSWRTAWRSLTKEAGLKGLRFHDLRHTVVTKLLESGAPEWVIMAIVGHVDRRMLDRYGHIRMQAKRAAIEFLSNSDIPNDTSHKEAKSEGHVTVHVTVPPQIPVYSDLNVDSIKGRNIGSCGFEPQTPTVSR
jgi:Phage integrase family